VSDAPASPKAGRLSTPSWLDARLVLGVLLVLVSVVVGARLLAAADRTQLMWSAARDLGPGTVLAAGDLVPVEVRLFDTGGRYLAGTETGFPGYVLERELSAGELVPLAALARPGSEAADLRQVSVPVLPGRFPRGLAPGQLVDVWSSPDRDAAALAEGAPQLGSRLVLEAVPVFDAPEAGGGLSAGTPEQAVVLNVRVRDVEALVAAMGAGRIDLVRVPGPRDREGSLAGASSGGSPADASDDPADASDDPSDDKADDPSDDPADPDAG
jgi:hypothetical protein